MSRLKTFATVVTSIVLSVFALTSCTSTGQTSATKKETTTQQNNYSKLVARQPADSMDYSPTRDTINFWIKTWGKPGKLSYVYLQNSSGDLLGYYVLKGLPVSMCTSLTPTYQLVSPGGSTDNGKISVPAPGMDGVFYSGGECNTYYGEDATSGAFIEFTAGLGINVLLYDQPLPNHPNVVNLSPGSK